MRSSFVQNDSGAVQLASIALFCKAAELSSFTQAARALGVTPAAVSRSITRLEARLKIRLFTRTTRQIRLTDDGRLYFEQCQQALAQINAAELSLTGGQAPPYGLLRVSVPTTYAHYRLLPNLPAFTAKYPEIAIELDISNRNIDFVEEGFDVAIRLGVPQESRLVARKLEDASLGMFAAPDYLARHGTPKSLADLSKHACIAFVLPSTGKVLPWLLAPLKTGAKSANSIAAQNAKSANPIEFIPTGPVRIAQDALGALSLARAGGGVLQIYHFIAAEAVARGELVEILPDHANQTRTFSALYPQNRHLSARVRAFVDFLVGISAQKYTGDGLI